MLAIRGLPSREVAHGSGEVRTRDFSNWHATTLSPMNRTNKDFYRKLLLSFILSKNKNLTNQLQKENSFRYMDITLLLFVLRIREWWQVHKTGKVNLWNSQKRFDKMCWHGNELPAQYIRKAFRWCLIGSPWPAETCVRISSMGSLPNFGGLVVLLW